MAGSRLCQPLLASGHSRVPPYAASPPRKAGTPPGSVRLQAHPAWLIQAPEHGHLPDTGPMDRLSTGLPVPAIPRQRPQVSQRETHISELSVSPSNKPNILILLIIKEQIFPQIIRQFKSCTLSRELYLTLIWM